MKVKKLSKKIIDYDKWFSFCQAVSIDGNNKSVIIRVRKQSTIIRQACIIIMFGFWVRYKGIKKGNLCHWKDNEDKNSMISS